MPVKTSEEIESYISSVGSRGVIVVRKAFRRQGFVKISTLTEKEIQEFVKTKEESIKQEMDIFKKQEELRKHLAKLRELRYGRKGTLWKL